MRFALVGNHPDGVEIARALAESGRHELLAYTGVAPEGPGLVAGGTPATKAVALASGNRPLSAGPARRVSDLEEVLADPAIDAVIVAGPPYLRPAQLRRALQSERHVLCVHPSDQGPEVAYEAAMMQKDTGCVLFPLLPEALHPGVRRLAKLVERVDGPSPVGAFRLLEVERGTAGEVLDNLDSEGQKPSFPGWDVLRHLGGEISDVVAIAAEEGAPGEPVLLAGRFEAGGLFQEALLPNQPAPRWRLTVVGTRGRAELLFPLGWQGPAFLTWCDAAGEMQEEHWEPWSPGPALLEAFEGALAKKSGGLDWQEEVRALELDDAARRSLTRRQVSALEYQEASEEVGFKGTMTLAGCALLWGVLLLLIVSRWVPQIGWVILPLLLVFIGMQLLRYIIPREPPAPPGPPV